MDYGGILSRAWTIVWEHKWLILLGVLVALTTRGPGTSIGGSVEMPWQPGAFDFRLPEMDPELWLPELRRELPVLAPLGVLLGLVLVSLAAIVGLVFWVVSTIARGGLIAGVNAIDAGEGSSFAAAWQAGWLKGWRLIGIGVLPAIPGLILAIVGLGAAGVIAGLYALAGERAVVIPGTGLGLIFVTITCILVPIALVLNLLQAFANRACMLEDLGVIDSYRRGLQVLVDNIGPALVLFLLQIVIGILLGVFLAVPRLVMVVCCLLWPVLLLIQGAIATYFSTMWTVAWRHWTGMGGPAEELARAGAVSEV